MLRCWLWHRSQRRSLRGGANPIIRDRSTAAKRKGALGRRVVTVEHLTHVDQGLMLPVKQATAGVTAPPP
ncbi:hypothetical protein [Porphyrobacter sp. AAP60]|uniref:hypothetical protein n=1 Tax=Porphyrobacter sp. AAP60 TaxID=1523423 RepID=UPI0006B9EC0A|nr:hypothetical protein [Porphyrobacter sp. AAP60]KPF63208.1 hypothetical protein IP79_09885 [Porphyrobacter sp. AAP60]